MSLLQKFGTGQGYLKAGFLGFPKSGKTFTATSLAIGTRKHFKLKGPLAMFDTEGGSEFIAPRVKLETKTDLIGVRSRSFDDLVTSSKEALAEGVSVLIVDSVTHIWRDLCASYLGRVNKARAAKNLGPRLSLEFQDWNPLKEIWNDKWTAFYLNAPLHIIICGRAGFEYDFTENEETGKRELVKTGIKMKTESEFGFEPSLLVEMERVQELSDGKRAIIHRATVLGDRFGVIDAKQGDNPDFAFFAPHVELLTPGAHAPVDTEARSEVPVDDDGWPKEKRERAILCEEIQGVILTMYPGQTTADKTGKSDLLNKLFKTRSWTKVESLDSKLLRAGLEEARRLAGQLAVPAEVAP
jgi:hypothetical protein